jgi:anti-anti-sigma factor
MNKTEFSFSDMIAGYVTTFTPDQQDRLGSFELKTSDNRQFKIQLTPNTYAELLRNLGEPYHDCTGQLKAMLSPGRYLFAYGILYPDSEESSLEVKHIVFVGRTVEQYLFEKPDWWVNQIRNLGNFYLKAQFEDGEIDYSKYRTGLGLVGSKDGNNRQETDTISRLVYGFSTAYMLTGDERYLEAAEKGTQYLRDHLRFLDEGEEICYWYHAINVRADGTEQKIFSSEFGDDYDAIPAYEQIYALAGPTQTYRVTGDPKILRDIEMTVNLFNQHFLDPSERGGFFSHIDPITFSPYSEVLGHNRAKKNWNSVGDHAPAYLINLWLATGKEEYADFLESTFDTIEEHFPDYENSPFVQERFHEDWSHDTTWGWQQNRAVVGHNLKIAWNLMRMYHLRPKESYIELAEKIAKIMPAVGSDPQRGGWYDVMERSLEPGQEKHRLVWHDRKAWWQQEQGILAYLLLTGSVGEAEYQKLARESVAFYNAWFLDYESGGVYFNVLANGIPYLLGTERGKGSHSMSGYHSFELAYLSVVYTNLLITKQPLDLYFKPKPGGFEDGILRVQPDILPPGSTRIGQVWINDQPYQNFDADNLEITLPVSQEDIRVRVRVLPATVAFSATLLETERGTAKISLAGVLDNEALVTFKAELEKISGHDIQRIVLLAESLDCITSSGLRTLVYVEQKFGADVETYVVGAKPNVEKFLEFSSLCRSIKLVDRYEEPNVVVTV